MKRLVCIVLLLSALGACTPVGSGTAAPSGGSCGEIILAGNPLRPTSARLTQQASACLAESFRSCTAKILTIREPDTGVVRHFSVIAGLPCILRQSLQTDPNTAPVVADCHDARLENNRLVVAGCSHLGDFVLIP